MTYRNDTSQKEPADARAYMKLRSGDLLTVPDKGTFEVVYFANGRKEAWKGPASIRIGTAESAPDGAKKAGKPEISNVPAGAVEGVKRIPPLLRKAGVGRSGATQVRGSGHKPDVKPPPELSKEELA